MNRLFNQFFNSLERGKVVLYGNVAIGASGAPTINALKSKGVASIARNSTGNYTITLNDKYVDLFGVSVGFISATASGVSYVDVVSQDVDGAKTIEIQCIDGSDADVDPTSGSTMQIELKLKSSTAP